MIEAMVSEHCGIERALLESFFEVGLEEGFELGVCVLCREWAGCGKCETKEER